MTLDLVCLVADKNMEATLSGLFSRPRSLGIREIEFELLVHPLRDPGCYHSSADLLAGLRADARHELVVLDYSWEGVPAESAPSLERRMEHRLAPSGLAPWAVPIVIYPELESWVWSPSPHVDNALGWRGRSPGLREALRNNGLWPTDAPKPPDPKAAVEWAAKETRLPRSSSIYRQIASRASTRRCQDRAFRKLRKQLQGWFPPEQEA